MATATLEPTFGTCEVLHKCGHVRTHADVTTQAELRRQYRKNMARENCDQCCRQRSEREVFGQR